MNGGFYAVRIRTAKNKERRGKVNIGLIGVGSIGTLLMEKLNRENILSGNKITAVFDERNKPNERLEMLSQKYGFGGHHALDDFLATDVEIVLKYANGVVVT